MYEKGNIGSREVLLGSDEEGNESSDDSEMSFFITENSTHGTWLTGPGGARDGTSGALEQRTISGPKDSGQNESYLSNDDSHSTSNRFDNPPEKDGEEMRPNSQADNAQFRDPSDYEGKHGPWFEGPDPFGDIIEDDILYDGPYESSSDGIEWSEHESGSEIDSFLGGSRRKKVKKPLHERLPPRPETYYRSLLVNGRRPVRRRNSSSSEDNMPERNLPEKKETPKKKRKFWEKWRVGAVLAYSAKTNTAKSREENGNVASD
ncbi:hypothetical protein DFP73DRAFT_598502 [Morchella snyderi]|nr:hypothetical protein DFP73DRAFT_598502 [Morchella snyderi]